MSPEVEVNGGFDYNARVPRTSRRSSEQVFMRLS